MLGDVAGSLDRVLGAGMRRELPEQRAERLPVFRGVQASQHAHAAMRAAAALNRRSEIRLERGKGSVKVNFSQPYHDL